MTRVTPPAHPQHVYRAPRDWTRVHPVSPFLGVWPIVGAVLFYVFLSRAPQWVSGTDQSDVSNAIDAISVPWWVIAGGVLAIMVVVSAFGYLGWRFNEYRIGDDAVYQRKGVLFRQQRQARLDRLQAVDVVQPLLARLTGFGAIRIEVAGGENSGIALEYLRIGTAEALRNEIIELAAGYRSGQATSAAADAAGTATDPAADAAAAPVPDNLLQGDSLLLGSIGREHAGPRTDRPAAAQRSLYAVPTGRLIGSIALSWPTFWLVLTPVWIVLAMIVFRIDVERFLAAVIGTSLVTAVPVLVGLFGYFWSQLNRGFGFTAGIAQDGIRLRHGMLETRRQTVPPGRVQAVRLRQSWWWRRPGWWEVTINVAGYQDNQDAVSTLLPVGTKAEALEAIWLVLPDMGLAGEADPDPDSIISAAMSGTGDDQGFTPSPARSRVFDLWQWHQRGVRATDTALIIRRGRFVKEVSIVPHERTQSLALEQGPLQRALRLATVEVHSTNGPVRPVAAHLDADDAVTLLEAQARRAREGRQRQSPEQWMKAVGLDS